MAVNFPWIYPVRVIQAIFGIIVLALTAYYISWFAYSSDSPNFMLFVACWTAFIATPYLALAPVFFPQLAHRIVIPAVEVITMIFWFAGFIALAVFLPPAEACHWSRCSALQAATVFGALEWVLFLVTSVFAVLGISRTRSSSSTKPTPNDHTHVGV
ncbi:hypothetical protein CBS63078_8702 [Aspergillus niger]|uniref:Membrane-associating domain-domain-containing protein n=3 Tax=Aspergillus subgen. Circumdati TaxID=2720871 RepID=A0A3F3Q0P0_9EURO|nr:hypothetical protein ANI_1_882084 [Aspergillus niger CBS 513.88]XP_026625609.1 membrane-associating domain-domain-containing protein [Aspergillus welwitschiae]EHA28612.1 hypothetical protein ASPNIDRAFT_212337 [Aspergillus niger ATCC 1015]KAI2819439.1 hypothetical protein CBS133816_10058 [Aspergillus niger]KAI2823252.1 hypothetical protein CBS115989_1630 [Aspergillus niger]KAI2846324.1 hypothetical protein CBS11350_3864 [Aspergillus niger]KAI2847113.1 hypothetical protein CBS12448_9395 [Asp|eukprot:XP_001393987.2 hypothetical protein ANI_1_882084 [Aspergillus niger CBS 513.88]